MLKRFYTAKEKFYKRLFIFQDKLKIAGDNFYSFLSFTFVLACLFFISVFIYNVGFSLHSLLSPGYFKLYVASFYVLYFSKYLQLLLKFKKKKVIAWIYDSFLFILSTILLVSLLFSNADFNIAGITAWRLISLLGICVFLIISELYKLLKIFDTVKISPLLLLAFSFLALILFGSGLLMLPTAHTVPVSYLDALFTSTSAVCVTGLVVLNTSTSFTIIGKIIILCLIQVGGLGIMAFTGFFSYAFTGSVSFRDRLMLKDMVSSDTLGGIIKLITKIILLTFLIEAIGALVLYFSSTDIVGNRIFFAIFHSISAFCNAGFTNLPGGLASPEIQHNYWVIFTVAALVILGGIGFPVLIMFYTYLKHSFLRFINHSKRNNLSANIASGNIGNRLSLWTTMILLIIGAVFYFLFQNNNFTQEQNLFSRITEAFFGSVNPRSSGFNIVDVSKWTYPTIFLMIFLMWIGASPGSTGGGIKTTTFAIAIYSLIDFIKGRNKVTVAYSQIGTDTISRVLVVIFLSILIIFIGTMGLLITDPLKNPVHLLFESVSAFAIVGLSIADSSTLSAGGKIIVIILMFIGRVGPLTLLTGIFISKRNNYSRYPERDLSIN